MSSRSIIKSAVLVQSIKNRFWKLRALENGQRNVATSAGGFRVFTAGGSWRDPIASSVQKQIVHALSLGERSRAASLLAELSRCALNASDFVYILEYCARSPDALFAMETWKHMEEKGVDMSGKCYLLAIQALCKGGYLKETFDLMAIMRENPDICPMLPVYNYFLGACVQMHGINLIDESLNMMEYQMVGKNEITYAAFLKLAVLQRNLPAVHKIWKECTRYYNPSIILLRKFVWSFTRLGDLRRADKTLQHMVCLALKDNPFIRKTAEGKLHSSRLDIPVPSLSASSLDSIKCCANIGIKTKGVACDGTSALQKPLSAHAMKVLKWSFDDVIYACAKKIRFGLAVRLMSQMQRLGLEPSCSTYDGFIRVVLSARGLHRALKLLRLMEQKGLRPYDSTLAALSVHCSRALDLDLAETFLDKASKSRSPYPYNAFFEACNKLDQPERALRMLAKMKQLNLQPDIRTYESLFLLFGTVNAVYEKGNMLSQVDVARRIKAIEMEMMENNIQHSHQSMKNLLKAFATEGMTKELIQYLQVAESQCRQSKQPLRISIYDKVLHSLIVAKEIHLAIEIFRIMRSSGIMLRRTTYHVMIDCCSIIRCFRSSLALLSIMIRSGFHPLADTYTVLLKVLSKVGDFDEALKLFNQFHSEGIQPDVVLYNTIIKAACKKRRINAIEHAVEQMHRGSISPNPTTCSLVFSAYVQHGFYNTAMEALQVLSIRMISADDTFKQKGSDFKNLILAEDLEAESHILELFKDSKENLAFALLNLRWCATLGFTISWSPDQSHWTKRLSSDYVSQQHSCELKDKSNFLLPASV